MSPWLYLIQQSASAWSLLTSLGLCMGLRRARLGRIALAAMLCGLAALLAARFPGWMLRLGALLALIVFAPLAAWPGVPRSQRPIMVLLALLLIMFMVGSARLLQALGLGRTPLILLLLPIAPLCARLLSRASPPPCISLMLQHNGQELHLSALVDSGNLLRDPLTALPVIVISRQAASRLMPAHLRLISVRTVTGSSLMPVFRPQRVLALMDAGWQETQAVIGLAPDGYNGFQALAPASLFTSQGGFSYVHDL